MNINSVRCCDFVWVPEATQDELILVFNQLAAEKQRSVINFQIEKEKDQPRLWGGDVPFWRGHYLSVSRVAEPVSSTGQLPDSLEAISLLAAEHIFNKNPGFGYWEGREIVCFNDAVVCAINPSTIKVRTLQREDATKGVYSVSRDFEN